MSDPSAQSQPAFQYQGTGRELQKQLLTKWYNGISQAEEKGEKVAYLFISGNIAELLRVFDFHLVYPEVNALQCGVRKVAGNFIMRAEDTGYSPDVCAYVKNDIGLVRNNNTGPFGRLSKPDLLVCTFSGCTTYIKWFEALAQMYDCPLFLLDVPFLREPRITPEDRRYVLGQFQELIQLCEKITGKKFDMDKLKEIVMHSRLAEDQWVKILQSAQRKPSPFDAYFEAVFFMAPIYVLRGTPECTTYYEEAYKEIEERIQRGVGPVAQERFRVVMEGPPPWPHFKAFWELFKKWGVCVVGSSYSKVGGIWDIPTPHIQGVATVDGMMRHDPDRPLDSIAEYAFNCYTNWNLQMRLDMLLKYYEDYAADGIVIHSVKSCRSFSVGQADTREVLTRKYNLPTLFIESDLADPRYFQEAQLRNRIDAYFEALEHRQLAGAAEVK